MSARWKLTKPGPASSTFVTWRGGSADEVVDELLGELARVAPGGLGRGHGHVRRPVAVLAPGRPLEADLGRRLDADGDERRPQRVGQVVAEHAAGWPGRRACGRQPDQLASASRRLTRSTSSSGSNGFVT